MRKTYHGSCHCGAIAYEAELDLAAGTARCNCTFCRRVRNWSAPGKPEDLRVIRGEEHLARYATDLAATHEHCFCPTCGVRLFSRGEIPGIGPFVSVMVTTLEDAGEDLAAAPVMFQDGLHGDWATPPEDVRGL